LTTEYRDATQRFRFKCWHASESPKIIGELGTTYLGIGDAQTALDFFQQQLDLVKDTDFVEEVLEHIQEAQRLLNGNS